MNPFGADALSPSLTPKRRRFSLSEAALFHATRLARRRLGAHDDLDPKRTTDAGHYRSWRAGELRGQLLKHFPVENITDCDVLDFGCGSGELSAILAGFQPNSITGVDMSPQAIRLAWESVPRHESLRKRALEFRHNVDHRSLPIKTDSIDLIMCFDVVEHIPDITAVTKEWHRVLRKGGSVWIWWSPWRGPFGHHLDSLIPVPWIHLLFREKTIFRVCAEIYDDPDFVPRIWDRDPANGAKKPNKWRDTKSFHPFLNKLTRARFERIVREAGLTISRREVHGFQRSLWSRMTHGILPVPLLGECVVSYYIYVLLNSATPHEADASE